MILASVIILILLASAYFRMPLIVWSILLAAALITFNYFYKMDASQSCLLWSIYAAIIIPLNIKTLRRNIFSRFVYQAMKKVMPTISQTEQEALDAGDVWWEAELFSGKPDFNFIKKLPKPTLTDEEQAFIDGPVEEFCSMLDDWQITHVDYDLSEEAWQFAKDNGFFSLIIPKQYGGLDYSAYCHSQVVMKI
jgi:acyl-CoA dehydrogenase